VIISSNALSNAVAGAVVWEDELLLLDDDDDSPILKTDLKMLNEFQIFLAVYP